MKNCKSFVHVLCCYLIVMLFLVGCSKQASDDNALYETSYHIEKLNLSCHTISYADLMDRIRSDQLDYSVLISRADCEACLSFLEELNNVNKESRNQKNVYILDSSSLSIEEKTALTNEYLISSVPTMIIADNNRISSIEIGNTDRKQVEEINQKIK